MGRKLLVLMLNLVVCDFRKYNEENLSVSSYEELPDDRKYRRQYAGPINLHYDKRIPQPLKNPGPEPDEDLVRRDRILPDNVYPGRPSHTEASDTDNIMMLKLGHFPKNSDFLDYISSIEKVFAPDWEEKVKKLGKWDDVMKYIERSQKLYNETHKEKQEIKAGDQQRTEHENEVWKHQVNIYRIVHGALDNKESKRGRSVTENEDSEENVTPKRPDILKEPYTGFNPYWEDPKPEQLTPATTTTKKPPKVPPQMMMKMAIEKLKSDYDKDGNLLPHKQQELALAALPTMVNFWETGASNATKNTLRYGQLSTNFPRRISYLNNFDFNTNRFKGNQTMQAYNRGMQNYQNFYGQQPMMGQNANPYPQQSYYNSEQYPQRFQGVPFQSGLKNPRAYSYYSRRFGNQLGQGYGNMYGQQAMQQQYMQNYQAHSGYPRRGQQIYGYNQNAQQYGGYGMQNGGYGMQNGGYGMQNGQQFGGYGKYYPNQNNNDPSLNNEDQMAKSIKSHQYKQNLAKFSDRFQNLVNPTKPAEPAPNNAAVAQPKNLTEDQQKMNKILFRAQHWYLGHHAGLPPPAFMKGGENGKVKNTKGYYSPTMPTALIMTRDDFGAPIKWVKSTSNKTKDGLAQVTDPLTGRQRTLKINGTLFVPIPDMDLGRLDKKFSTTKKRTTTSQDLRKSSQDTAVQTMMRNTDLKLLQEADWLAFEVALGQKFIKNEHLDCDSDDCQSRCMRTGCEVTCTGNTCASGCVGRGCSAYCNGEGCMAMCIGEDCNAKCEGMACDTRCIGKPCEAKCTSFNCYLSMNGDGKIGGGTFDQHYDDRGGYPTQLPAPNRDDLLDYND